MKLQPWYVERGRGARGPSRAVFPLAAYNEWELDAKRKRKGAGSARLIDTPQRQLEALV